MKYSSNELIKFYEQMVLGRKYEEKVMSLVNQGKLQGFFHLSIGQEAAQVGVVSAMGPNDYLVPTHRFHTGLVNRMDMKDMTCELLGRITGCNKGKAFTFHISSKKDRILSVNGMLGAGVPNAVGYAWTLKMNKQEGVVVCVFGDGASSEGDVHEAMNLATIHKIPIVFFIENNGWAVSTPLSTQAAVENLSVRAKAYNMPGVTVDGDDVIKVNEAMKEAIALARNGQPSIVEAKTHRWRGHFEGDPAMYRDANEIEEAKKNCPIKRLEKMLLDKKLLSPEQIEEIVNTVQNELEEVFTYAMGCPLPTKEQTLDYDQVYASNLGGDLW